MSYIAISSDLCNAAKEVLDKFSFHRHLKPGCKILKTCKYSNNTAEHYIPKTNHHQKFGSRWLMHNTRALRYIYGVQNLLVFNVYMLVLCKYLKSFDNDNPVIKQLNSGYKTTRLYSLECQNLEVMWVHVRPARLPRGLVTAAIYHPPS